MYLLSGPCAIEDHKTPFIVAETMQKLAAKYGFTYIFKASVKKANRSRLDSFTGIAEEEALEILQQIKTTYNVPIVTDIHESPDAAKYGKVADYLQIPAFLCRQTDLLLAAGETGRTVNIKKGQFSSPESMQFAVNKVRSTGNEKVMLTERGTFFGYQDLVVDFRGIVEMKKFNVPVILDCTHSLQRPNQTVGVTGGSPEFIETIAKAGVATGVDGLFIEVHPDPSKALSDGANMLQLDKAEALLAVCMKIKQALE
ncbi:MAG: 3-deoxy-8-phosphooctulonate synthase [Luteibaculaceae bacterium]